MGANFGGLVVLALYKLFVSLLQMRCKCYNHGYNAPNRVTINGNPTVVLVLFISLLELYISVNKFGAFEHAQTQKLTKSVYNRVTNTYQNYTKLWKRADKAHLQLTCAL